MGKGSGSQTVVQTPQITPEQRELLKAQTDFFTNTLSPLYKNVTGQAGDVYKNVAGNVNNVSQIGQNAALGVAGQLGGQGAAAYNTGLSGLSNLFSEDYKQQQLQAALQPGQEAYQQDLADLGTQFGGAGGLGSARSALAGTNLASLNAQRQGTVAANVLGGIEDRRAGAANQLAGYGQQGLGSALNAISTGQQFAQSPLNTLGQYAGILYGVPGASVSPNFQGTQGQTQQTTGRSKSANFFGG